MATLDIDALKQRATQAMIDGTKEALAGHLAATKLKVTDEQVKVESDPVIKTIVVPEEMNKLQASYTLIKQFEEEEVLRKYNRMYPHYFVNDFLSAIGVLIPKFFGMLHISPANTEGKKASNDYIQFPVRFEKDKLITEKGYVGSILAPVWENAIIDIHAQGALTVKAKMKFEKQVNLFLEEVADYLKKYSIVRGTAVKVNVLPFGLMTEPINPKENKKIVLGEQTERLVSTLIIPSLAERSKTSLLFTGDFGTGKTETAIRVGIQGQRKFGRTFFYVENAAIFGNLVPYIKNYQPSTIFVEDIDQISSGDRDSDMNDLLNQLDGNELKNVDVTFIFTTNNHDKIHPGMRRPGRIDQVLHFDYTAVPDIAKIFQIYADGMDGYDQVDFMDAAMACPAKLQGAVVAEISRRAVKYAKNLYNGEISTNLFLTAIDSMRAHIDFMRKDQVEENRAEDLLGKVLYKGLKNAFPKIDLGDGEDFEDSPYKNLPK
jgi:hypothetical protein